MRDTADTGMQHGTPGARMDLHSRSKESREGSKETSSGGRRMGTTSRWTALRAWENRGGESGEIERIEAASNGDI